MNGFKLIAVVPLKGCDERFRKNLVSNTPYLLFQDYQIDIDAVNDEISAVHPPKNPPISIYNSEFKINISAIVGENGSGKSTLIELLYYSIYFLSTKIKNSKRIPIIESAYDKLSSLLNVIDGEIKSWEKTLRFTNRKQLLLTQLTQKYDIKLSEKSENKKLHHFIGEKLRDSKRNLEYQLEQAKKMEEVLNSSLNVAIVFENDSIYSIEVKNGKFSHSKYLKNGKKILCDDPDKFKLVNFFYSISVNYSHHSLNSNTIGEWINALFHKNDAYQTPVVINPMRHHGNFSINHELNLLRERLIGNVTFRISKDPDYKLLSRYRFEKFIFHPKRYSGDEVVGYQLYIDDFEKYKSAEIVGRILNCFGVENPYQDNVTSKAIGYLDKKIFRVLEQYPFLFKSKIPISGKISHKLETELVKFINTDLTHITKKIRQTIYFLSKYNSTPRLRTLWSHSEDDGIVILNNDEMKDWLSVEPKSSLMLNSDVLDSPYYFSLVSLPGFMTVDFEITDTEKGNTFRLSDLSSGEQQMILNLNSITYHLHNIQSIHANPERRVAYKNINILLDEIELYYHPNSQRNLISELLNAIDEVKHLGEDGVQAINICFSTHSPFILSDIPAQNILKLEDGKPKKYNSNEKTFGANIHDLLNNSFFLKEGSTGKFAKEKISSALYFLQSKIDPEKFPSKSSSWSKENIHDFIKMIGEPLIEKGLLDLYKRAFVNDKSAIQKEIDRLIILRDSAV